MKKLTERVRRIKGEAIGLDVHKDLVVFSRLDRRGQEVATGRFRARREDLLAFLAQHAGERGTHVSLEASGGMLWVYDLLVERLGHARVHVAQSRRIRAIANSQEKNDANDAWWLAYLTLEGRLPECFMPEGDLRELRLATRERQSLVELRTRLVVQLRSHLRQSGLHVQARDLLSQKGWAAAHEVAQKAPGCLGEALRGTLALVESVQAAIGAWEARIESLAERFPETRALQREIPGVGKVIASVIVAESGPIRRFHSAKAYGKYTGLTPSDRSTGGRTIHGSISRTGSPHLRRALAQAVVACGRCGRGPGAAVGAWVKTRQRRTGQKLKVRVAAARKLAEGIWRLFALGECFDVTRPFGMPPASAA